jgi:hypothetical protein
MNSIIAFVKRLFFKRKPLPGRLRARWVKRVVIQRSPE